MILGAAFCPHPPLLVPALSGSGAADVADLVAGCDSAIDLAVAPAARILVLGSDIATREFPATADASLVGYGGVRSNGGSLRTDADRDGPSLPLSLAIGRRLLERRRGLAGVRMLAVGAAAAEVSLAVDLARAMIEDAEAVALLVMGDGTARRGLRAPGYLDDRSEPFDAGVRDAIAAGDAAGLAALDADLGADLLAAGVPAWRVAGTLLAGAKLSGAGANLSGAGANLSGAGAKWKGHIFYAGDPFGVFYLAAAWTTAATVATAPTAATTL